MIFALFNTHNVFCFFFRDKNVCIAVEGKKILIFKSGAPLRRKAKQKKAVASPESEPVYTNMLIVGAH